MIYGNGYNSKPHKYKMSNNGKALKSHKTWVSMLQRCYDAAYQVKGKSYINCEVVDQWKDFQEFADWYYSNIYYVDGEAMCLDKDLRISGNKLYSPETCLFLPVTLNMLLINSSNSIGKCSTVGVYFHKRYGKYATSLSTKSIGGRREHLGYFDTPEEAFSVYKEHRESYIVKVANLYKSKIPPHAYELLINYKIGDNT